jgi:sensor c-di-GMP phosphodiesterase-like protein
MSKPFIVVVALLVVPTVLYFWNDSQESAKRRAEIDRQNRVAEKVYHAISRYADSPNGLTEHEAQVAIDLASEEHLSRNRKALLFNYYISARRCNVFGKYKGIPEDCRKMIPYRTAAFLGATYSGLDTDQ